MFFAVTALLVFVAQKKVDCIEGTSDEFAKQVTQACDYYVIDMRVLQFSPPSASQRDTVLKIKPHSQYF